MHSRHEAKITKNYRKTYFDDCVACFFYPFLLFFQLGNFSTFVLLVELNGPLITVNGIHAGCIAYRFCSTNRLDLFLGCWEQLSVEKNSIFPHYLYNYRNHLENKTTTCLSSSTKFVFKYCSVLPAKSRPLAWIDIIFWKRFSRVFVLQCWANSQFLFCGLNWAALWLLPNTWPFFFKQIFTESILEKCVKNFPVLITAREWFHFL